MEVLFLGTASVSGLYYRKTSDAAHFRTVDGTRTGIQQRVKLECEREQQEQLLLSVIPAYIAAEVSEIEKCNFYLLKSICELIVFSHLCRRHLSVQSTSIIDKIKWRHNKIMTNVSYEYYTIIPFNCKYNVKYLRG